MKNYTRIIITLSAIIMFCGCGMRTQKNSGSLTADTPTATVTTGEVKTADEVPSPVTPDSKEHPTLSDTSFEGILPEPPVVHIVMDDAIHEYIDYDVMPLKRTEIGFADVELSEVAATSFSITRSPRGGACSGEGIQSRPGTITAGEWNDLDNWSFWRKVSTREEFRHFPSYWEFYCDNRVSVMIEDQQRRPVVNSTVKLMRGKTVLYTARTDNFGNAVLWIGLSQKDTSEDYSGLRLEVDGKTFNEPVMPFSEGINRITMPAKRVRKQIDVAFVVDATGSMADELEYLKTELVDVIENVKEINPEMNVRTSAVFYRDVGDEYITRVSNFESDVNKTAEFIRRQYAAGGGDYPEAVHTALEKATGELKWSDDAHTRIMFLLLDAPPHHHADVIGSLHETIPMAAAMGIKVIPIVASGIDKETEFLMRFFALATGGTYVFITDHSGVGNAHLEPSVGEYQVEYLNDLMVRLIAKYSE